MCNERDRVRTRASGPFGPHMIVCGANAPNDAEEERVYKQMLRIRAYDADPSYLAESDPTEWPDRLSE